MTFLILIESVLIIKHSRLRVKDTAQRRQISGFRLLFDRPMIDQNPSFDSLLTTSQLIEKRILN